MERVLGVYLHFDSQSYEAGITNENDRIRNVINHLYSYGVPEVVGDLESVRKNAEDAIKFRDEGTCHFRKYVDASLDKAFEEYTRSVAYSPLGSGEIALAYSNRSAVLFKAGLFPECLSEIERALQNPLPDRVKTKIYIRKAICLRKINPEKMHLIKEALVEAQKWMPHVDIGIRGQIEKSLREEENMKKEKKKKKKKNSGKQWEENLPVIKNKNRLIPGTSDAVKLQYSEEFGRHMIATRDIRPGEALAVQKIYAKVVLLEMRYKLCWHCGQQTWTGMPCENCVDVVFCSESCKQQAQAEYHDIECRVLGLLIRTDVSAHTQIFGMRLAIMALKEVGGSLEALRNYLERVDANEDPLTKGFTNGILDPTKFASLYGLERNYEKKMSYQKTSFVARAVTVAYFLATKSGFFGREMSEDLRVLQTDDEFIFLVNFITTNFQLINTNECTMGKAFGHLHDRKVIETVGIMTPAMSLYNHRCHRMVYHTYHGHSTTLRAIYKIKKGEQIFVTCTKDFTEMTKEDRQSILSNKYHLDCKCKACQNDWPVELSEGNMKKSKLSTRRMQVELTREILEIDFARRCLTRTRNHYLDASRQFSKVREYLEKVSNELEEDHILFVCGAIFLGALITMTSSQYLSLDEYRSNIFLDDISYCHAIDWKKLQKF